MNSIRIINMRSLVDTGTIDLKPINMLVGSNSSGKSTFLRVFGVRIDIWTHLMRGCIINYVH